MAEVHVSSHSRWRHRLLRDSILLASLIIGGNLAMILLIPNAYQKLVFMDVTYPLWDVWAMLGLGYAAWRSARQSRRLAVAWGCLAAAALSSGLGNSLWALVELRQGSVPVPSFADFFYLAVYPLFLCGVLLFPTKQSYVTERLKVAVDLIIILIAATIAFGYYVLHPAIVSVTEVSQLAQVVAFAYPVGDMILLWAVLVLLYRENTNQRLGPLLLLALATGITIVADSIYSTQMLLETYKSAGILDLSWILTSLLYGIAGVWQGTADLRAAHAPSSNRVLRRLKLWLSCLPYLCVVSTYLLIEANHDHGEQLGAAWQSWGMGFILLLVILRLLLKHWENRQQAQTLHRMNLALQEEIHERKHQDKQIQRYVRTLEALNQIHLSLTAELDLDKLVQLVTDVATDLSGAEFGAFFYHQQNQEDGYHHYSLSGVARDRFVHFPIPRNTHLFGPMFRGEERIRVADVTQDPRYGLNPPYAGTPSGHPPVRSYLAVPVVTAQNEVIGGLVFGHRQPGVFTEQSEDLVAGIAAQAAVAVQKATLYRKVKEREEQFRRLIEDAADGIWVGDQAGVCQEANTTLCHLLGYTREELLGRRLTDLVLPADAAQLAAVQEGLQLQEADVAEWTFLHQNGTPIPVEISIKALSAETWQAIVRDITERKRLEELERQQERLAVVGQLAAGIAHDFNNSLSVILLQAQLALHSPVLPAKDRQRLQTVCEQTQHAAQLTTQILDFSRQSVLEYQEIDVSIFLTEIVRLLKRTLPEQIGIGFSCETQPALVKADVTRLQQALMNLAINARDAMPQGGKLHIGLTTLAATVQQRLPSLGTPSAQWHCITVADSGEGMAPDVLSHIFEPFFTTKPRGKGTGLGLAQVHGIIQQHGGVIEVTSQPNQGTTFHIYLPALHATRRAAPATRCDTIQLGHAETILVVEDNAATRTVVADMLHALNYQVLTAADGKEALHLYTENSSTVALVLSDLVMPRMDGKSLLQQLKKNDTGVKLVMMSGYPQPEAEIGVNGDGATVWLPKPFTLEQVAVAVHKTLTA